MLFDPKDAAHLKPWLIRTLEPICDAEPGALADYIQALLKHNASEVEMRKELAVQLEEFLEKECQGFLDSLFNVLRTKSYLPYSSSPPPPPRASSSSAPSQHDAGIPIPLDGLVSSSSGQKDLKRRMDSDDETGMGRPAAKGPRLDPQFSRYGNGRGMGGGYHDTGRGGGQLQNGSVYTNGRTSQYAPPEQRRGICRDYFNNGYCARGALCKFSHGDDAIVPSQLFQTMNMMYAAGAMGGAPYDPMESRLDMQRQHSRPPIMHRARQEEGLRTHGELPVIQDLTPRSAEDAVMQSSEQPMPIAPMVTDDYPPMQMGHNQMDIDTPQPQPMRGGYRGRGRPHQGGTFDSQVPNFRPDQRNDKTLVVEKIPVDKLRVEEVNNWFKRFGSVTNVAIDTRSAKALVTFAEHSDARAAWKSEDAVFGNRFVKVFWHRPMQGHGQAGAKALAASAPLVANLANQETTKPTIPAPAKKATSSASSALAAKQQLLEKQIAEQKSLMESLSSASAEEKKDIMARLRKLGEEMKPSAEPDAESQEKQKLDKELDSTGVTEGTETTEDLKAKLEKLKAEAASLGITDESVPHGSSGYRGGYRGRGRGRGFYRGGMRGGPLRPMGSMKLDNRPKKLLIQGVPADNLSTIKDWYETTGQVDSAETTDDGDIIISFKTRAGAEQGLAKGSLVPTIGQVQVSWHPSQISTSSQKTQDTPLSSVVTSAKPEDGPEEGAPSTADSNEQTEMDDEVVAGGWGGDEHAM